MSLHEDNNTLCCLQCFFFANEWLTIYLWSGIYAWQWKIKIGKTYIVTYLNNQYDGNKQ
ncbi:MAG: hypothetical protein AB2L20_24870 [Mangrovibacterium sp.]